MAAAQDTVLQTAQWPNNVTVEGIEVTEETDLKGWVLAFALLLLAIDCLASLAIGGRLKGPRAEMAAIVLGLTLLSPQVAEAQEDDFALYATSNVVLGYVLTGNAQTDEISEAGLTGLSQTLFRRTTIEPSAPVGVNLETDELAFFGQVDFVLVFALGDADRFLHAIGENVGHGDQADFAARGVHRLHGRLPAATTATNQTDLDRVAAERVGAAGGTQSSGGANGAAGDGEGATLDEFTAGGVGLLGL